MKNIIEAIEKSNIGRIEKDVLLSKYTTYKVGGKAKVIVYPKNVDCLIKLMKIISNNNVKYKILGNGLSKLNEKFTTHETNKRINIHSTFI